MADVKKVIATAVEFERFGAEYYRKFKDLVEDKEAKALMASLAADEAEHAAILTRELQTLGGRPKAPSGKDVEEGLAKIFPDRPGTTRLGVKDAISAIEVGIETEKRSIEFYSSNAAAAGLEAGEVFARLERMEREHLRLLQENLRYLRDDGSWLGYVPILEG